MNIKAFFEGKQLPISKEELGVISIDTMERLWLVLMEVEDNRLVLISKDDKDALIGKMAIREDGKFCLVIEIKGKVREYLEEIEQWHCDDYGASYDDLVHELCEAGKLH